MTETPLWRRVAATGTERALVLATACLMLVCVIAALAVAGLALRSSNASSTSATAQSKANSEQITALNDSIVAARANTSAKLLCDQTFDSAVTRAFREYQARIGDLIEQSITDQTGVAVEVDEMGVALDNYRAIATQQAAYINAGRPQPCPLTP